MALIADRLSRSGRARNQQMRHARKIRDDRHPADILAERQRERRSDLIIGFRLDDLAEVTISRFSLGISRPTTDLPGMISTTRTLIDDKRARQILGKIADLADLDAGRRAQLKTRDDGTWLHGDDLGFDAEVAQLDFDEPRHRLERIGRVGLFAGRGSSSSESAGNSLDFGASNNGTCRSRSTRSLLSGCGAAGSMRGGTRLGDFLLLLAHPLLARLLAQLPRGEFAALIALMRTHSTPAASSAPSASMTSNHETPRNKRDAREPEAEQQQRCAQEAQARRAARRRPVPRAHRRRCCGSAVPPQCRVASPQLVTNVSTNPVARSTVLRRERESRQRLIHVHQPTGISQHQGKDTPGGRTGKRRIRRATRRPGRSNLRWVRVHRCRRIPDHGRDRKSAPTAISTRARLRPRACPRAAIAQPPPKACSFGLRLLAAALGT